MSVAVSVLPRPPFSHRPAVPGRAGRVGLLFALVVALVAGVMSGVARADDTGGFTPVDFSQAPPPPAAAPGSLGSGITITGGFTVSGDVGSFPDGLGQYLSDPLTYLSVNRPAVGEAHLFSRTSGLAPMTDDQYAGMVAMEHDAVLAVMDLHGITNTPTNHDLVIRYARDDVTAALYARLTQAANDPTPTAAEQSALNWLVAVAQAHAVGAAQEARHQFDLWSADHCTFRPPAPYADYDISGSPGCRGLSIPGAIPQQDKSPTAEQFVAWGAAAYDAAHGSSTKQALFATSVSEVAIAFGAAGGFLAAGGLAGLAATYLLPVAANGVSGVVNAISPFFARSISAVIERSGGLAAELTSVGVQGALRLVGLVNLFAILGPALIIATALVQIVLAGLDAFSANRAQATLDSALDRARSTPPDLRNLLSSSDGEKQVFLDLTGSVLDCNTGPVIPGECDILATQPQRRSDDPVLTSTDQQTGARIAGPTADLPITLGTLDNPSDTTLSIRDGWFVVGSDPAPQQTLRYTDDFGVLRTLRLVRDPAGGYAFQSLITPTNNTVKNTGFDTTVADCTSHAVHDYCYTGTQLSVLDSRQHPVTVSLATNRAPTAPVVTASGPASVGMPVTFTASLPPNTPADPDGNTVTSTWTAELDQPCVKATVGTFDWACVNPSAPRNGPHGGYLQQLPAGDTGTVVWNTPGTYRVTRTVTDGFGISTATSVDVQVAAARQSLFAACLQCDTTGGRQVQIAGRINSGAHRDAETVTIDWGDGTTTSGVPTRAHPGNLFLSQTFWATIENSAQYQFQAVHTYAAGSGANRRITVSATDTGDGNPPPVTLAADAVPVADPSSYGDIVSDRLVDYPIPVRLPLFVDSAGNRLTPACTAPDGFGTGRVETVTDFTPFRTGVTVLVTCTATAASGLSSTVTFSVTTHQITATATASAPSTAVGAPVTFTVRGTTDDGRDVGDISDRVTMQATADGVQCEGVVCSRTSTSGPITAVPVADDNVVGSPVTVGVTPGAAAQIHVVDGGPRSVPVDSTVATPYSFVVQDAYGNPVPGTPVTLAVTSGKGTVAGGRTSVQTVSAPDGVVTFAPSVGPKPGALVVKATVNADVVAQFTTTGTRSAGLVGLSGNAQRARVGGGVKPLVAVLLGADGQPVANRRWAAQVVSGPATIDSGHTGTAGMTGADGTITVALDRPAAAGDSVIRISANGVPVLTQTFTATPNSAPTAVADAYTTVARSGPMVTTAANGVLDNDRDADGDQPVAVLRGRPKHGTLTLGRSGAFTYTPTAGYSGTDTFMYSASDGLLSSAPQTVTLTVQPASADVAVTRDIPAQVTRGTTFTLGVVVVDYGPSVAQSVVVTTALPKGLTFGDVPPSVTLSSDRRTATYAVSSVDIGGTARTDLPVLVASTARTGKVLVTGSATAPTTPDSNPANDQLTSATTVVK